MAAARDIEISGETIRLGQLLKLSAIVTSGGEGKALLAGGGVRVNGVPESRRGRQLRHGDVLEAGGEAIRVLVAGTRPGEAAPGP